jgi:hypothetical protein
VSPRLIWECGVREKDTVRSIAPPTKTIPTPLLWLCFLSSYSCTDAIYFSMAYCWWSDIKVFPRRCYVSHVAALLSCAPEFV